MISNPLVVQTSGFLFLLIYITGGKIKWKKDYLLQSL